MDEQTLAKVYENVDQDKTFVPGPADLMTPVLDRLRTVEPDKSKAINKLPR